MPDQKAKIKEKLAISKFVQPDKIDKLVQSNKKLFTSVDAWTDRGLQWVLGLTRGWKKRRDIVNNNYDLGVRYLKLGYVKDAIFRFKIVTWMEPERSDAWYFLGCGYLSFNQESLAQQALKKAVSLKPDYEEANYMLAIASRKKMPVNQLPKRMPLSLVMEHFEQTAANYDKEQLDVYKYQGHTVLSQAVHACLVPGRIDYTVLDLGVGTGLCGSLFRDIAAQLTGVDVSATMLEEAMKRRDTQGKKIYDALIRREVHDFLREIMPESYDLLLAADLFSYIGDVEVIFQQAARILKFSGGLAFTADILQEGESFQLDPEAGRFRFSQGYLRRLAEANNLREIKFEEVPVYQESKGWLCIFTK